MSDEQIRDIFQNAEEWTPDENVERDDDGNGIGGSSGPNSVLPPVELGSDVEIAGCVAQVLCQERGEVVFSEGAFWYYAGSHWRRIADHELRLALHRFDGAALPGNRAPVKLNKTRVDSIIHELTAMRARPEFFNEAPVGINSRSHKMGRRDPDPRLERGDSGNLAAKWLILPLFSAGGKFHLPGAGEENGGAAGFRDR